MLHSYIHQIVFEILGKKTALNVITQRTRIINALMKEASFHDVNATTEKSP